MKAQNLYDIIVAFPFSLLFLCLHQVTVDEVIMFVGCPLEHPSVRLSSQILLPRYLMNGWNSFDKTVMEYLLAPTNHLIRFWCQRSRVKVTAGPDEGIDALTLSIKVHLSSSSAIFHLVFSQQTMVKCSN